MKRISLSDTLLETIIVILSEYENGGFVIDAMMQSSSELNKRLTSEFFYPMIKQASRAIRTDGTVLSVACSPQSCPDSQRIVSGCGDMTVRIWDVITGKQIGDPLSGNNYVVGTQSSHTGYVGSVAWSPDGQRIVSGSSDNTIRIWDAQTGKQIGEPLNYHTRVVNSVAWSPDSQRIVSGSDDKTVQIWNTKTGKQIKFQFEGSIKSVAWSPDGQRIVFGSDARTIIILDAHTGKRIGSPLCGHSGTVYVAWSPDGQRIVSGCFHKMIVWNAHTGEEIRETITGPLEWIESLAFSPNSMRIISGNFNGNVKIWDTQTGKQIGKSLIISPHTNGVAWSPDGQRIIAGSQNSKIRIWLL